MACCFVETRFWAGYEDELYTKAEWRSFARLENPQFSEEQVDVKAEKLWNLAFSRLCDQPTVEWRKVLELQAEGTCVAMVSTSRAHVDVLKPVCRNQGLVVTFGRPGDAMTGLRTSDPDTWVLPWMAKTIGAISAVAAGMARTRGPIRIVLVYMSAEMGTGSQSEWQRCEILKQKILQEIGINELLISHLVVDTDEVLSYFGFDRHRLQRLYHGSCKKVVFIRHGESESNALGRDAAHPRLTSNGHVQAGRLSIDLLSAHVVVTSPHIRCLQTLQHLNPKGHSTVIVSDCVGELNRDELQNVLPSLRELDGFLKESGNLDAKLMMNMQQGQVENVDLASQALETLSAINAQTIVVVTHRVLIREVTGKDVSNCQIVECELDHGNIESVSVR